MRSYDATQACSATKNKVCEESVQSAARHRTFLPTPFCAVLQLVLPMTRVVVDNRERCALLPLFRELSDGFHVEALPVGDVLVEFAAGHGFLVERKTAADLASSICGGRSSSFKSIVAII